MRVIRSALLLGLHFSCLIQLKPSQGLKLPSRSPTALDLEDEFTSEVGFEEERSETALLQDWEDEWLELESLYEKGDITEEELISRLDILGDELEDMIAEWQHPEDEEWTEENWAIEEEAARQTKWITEADDDDEVNEDLQDEL